MWLCTSPAYDTVHMRSIAIDIRLHKNSGYLCCSHTHTDDRLRLSLYPNCTVSTTCFLIHVNTTRATVLALVGKKKKKANKKNQTFFY